MKPPTAVSERSERSPDWAGFKRIAEMFDPHIARGCRIQGEIPYTF